MSSTVHRTLFVATIACLLAGCSGNPKTINSYWVPGQKLPDAAEYFAWPPPDQTEFANFGAPDPTFDDLMRSTIEQGFESRGYTFQPEGRPDFVIRYRIGRQVRQAETGTDSWDEVDLAIDAINPNTSKLIWVGSLQTRIDYSAAPDVRRKRVETAVEKVLEKFPKYGME